MRSGIYISNLQNDRKSLFINFIKPVFWVKVTPESSATLLVHFCTGSDSIHRHEEDLSGLDDAEEHLQVVEDVGKNLLLRDAKVYILIIGVWALVDDAVHVQV